MENQENNYVAPEVVEETPLVEETPVVEENPYGQDFASYKTEYVSKKEYLQKHAPESFYKTIKTCAIVSYVLIGMNVLMLIINPLGIFDIAIMLGLTLGVHLKKVKGCAIALLCYGIFNCVVGLLAMGTPAGIAWIVVAIIYMVQFSKAEKEYKAIYGA